MKERTTLTKSLHTVTIVSRVAADIGTRKAGTPAELVDAALDFIGQPGPWPADDATVAACIKATEKLIAKAGK